MKVAHRSGGGKRFSVALGVAGLLLGTRGLHAQAQSQEEQSKPAAGTAQAVPDRYCNQDGIENSAGGCGRDGQKRTLRHRPDTRRLQGLRRQ